MSRRRKHQSSWIAVAVLGGIAGVVGIVALTKRASASELPPANPLLTPVTDPIVVREWQTKTAAATKSGALALFGLGEGDYNANDVDGNPNNPRWMRVVSIVQTFVNALLPTLSEQERAKLPAGYPTQLRTDGVLDNATAIAFEHL